MIDDLLGQFSIDQIVQSNDAIGTTGDRHVALARDREGRSGVGRRASIVREEPIELLLDIQDVDGVLQR